MQVQDTFVRTAADLDGSTTSDGQTTWVEDFGTLWVTDGDEASISTPDAGDYFSVAHVVRACDTPNQYAEITIARRTRPAGTLSAGLQVRSNAALTAGYAFEIFQDAGGVSSRRIYNFATDATLVSDAVATTTGVLRLEALNDLIRAYVNGVLVLSVVDTAWTGVAGQTGVGMQCFAGANTGNGLGISLFRGGDTSPAAVNASYANFPKEKLRQPDRVDA